MNIQRVQISAIIKTYTLKEIDSAINYTSEPLSKENLILVSLKEKSFFFFLT